MRRLLLYAACAIAVFSATYGESGSKKNAPATNAASAPDMPVRQSTVQPLAVPGPGVANSSGEANEGVDANP